MYRRNIVGISALVMGLAMLPGGASAQQKSMKDLLVGTWTLLLDDGVKEDGTHVPGYGPNPDGSLIFTADGHYSLQIYRYGRPAFASKSRLTGTADENKAAVQGMIAYFGTYAVDEAAKTLTLRIEASSFPNLGATAQKRVITAVTDQVLTYNNPAPAPASCFVRAEVAWKKAK
jgi:Lipocalin-like domain